MVHRFQFGELNPNISARSGQQIDPNRLSKYDVQRKLVDDYLAPTGFKNLPGPLRGIVLRVESPSFENPFGPFHGLRDLSTPNLIRIKVRIPEIHPYPEPDVYGPEGDDGLISLYPTFTAVNNDCQEPAVGDIVYVDYGDRENLEDAKYFGKVFNKPVFGGTNVIENPLKASSYFDGTANQLKDLLGLNGEDFPFIKSSNETPLITNDDIINVVRNFWQSAKPWGKETLGFSSNTIGRAGCLLTVLTIATNSLKKEQFNPKQTNIIVRDRGGFDGNKLDNLLTSKAATILGLTTKDKVKGSLSSMKNAVDITLQNGGMAILHMDFKGKIPGSPSDGVGDHFILIHSRKSGIYEAADPAYGVSVNILSNLNGDTSSTKSNVKFYKPISVTPIFKAWQKKVLI